MEKKLTAEQITVIEASLLYCGLKQEDLKLEVTDHIASEIEDVMSTNTLSFEENFEIIFNKWSAELKPSFSIFTGIRNSYPKIVLDKKKIEAKRQLVIGSLLSMTFLFAFFGLKEFYDSQSILYYFQLSVRFLFSVGYMFLIVMTMRIWNSKLITSFNQYSKEKVKMYLLFVLPICSFTTPEVITNQVILIVLSTWILFHLLISFQLVMKHIQFEKKLATI
jgi:hypothetical protein